MTALAVSVDVERGALADGAPAVVIKLQTLLYELNIWLEPSDLEPLSRARKAAWREGSVRAGVAAASPVFWSCDDGVVFIAVGQDDETWDFGVSVPLSTFDELLARLAALSPP